MMANKKIAVIGAGIVGLYLAKRLKEKGLKVVVFEKNKEIGQKPCTGLISERIFEFIPEASKIAKRKVNYLVAHFSKKDVKIQFKPCLYLFERKELDNLVAMLAKEAGVELRLGEKINGLPKNFFRIIGCDGALSTTRELLGLPAPFRRLGLQYFYKEDSNLEIEIWPKKEVSGFIWRVPREGIVEYGILGNPRNSYQIFIHFLNERNIEMRKENFKAALVPSDIVLPKHKKITLCGDAAGLTTPSSGGGVVWGLKAAEILVEEFPDFLSYRKKVYKFFSKRILKTKIIMKTLYFLSESSFTHIFPKKVEIDPNLFYSFLSYKIYF